MLFFFPPPPPVTFVAIVSGFRSHGRIGGTRRDQKDEMVRNANHVYTRLAWNLQEKWRGERVTRTKNEYAIRFNEPVIICRNSRRRKDEMGRGRVRNRARRVTWDHDVETRRKIRSGWRDRDNGGLSIESRKTFLQAPGNKTRTKIAGWGRRSVYIYIYIMKATKSVRFSMRR